MTAYLLTPPAAELATLAAAGGLTPYATYIASDDPYPQWAIDASTHRLSARHSAGTT